MKFELQIPKLLELDHDYNFDNDKYFLNNELKSKPKIKIKEIMTIGSSSFAIIYAGKLTDPVNKTFFKNAYKKLNKEEKEFYDNH
jgi:hypothetical protein